MSCVHQDEEQQKPELEQEQAQDSESQPHWRTLSARVRRQAFLVGAAHFLGLHPIERAYLGNAELQRCCWQLCDAQVSFGLAPAQDEYLLTERLYGTLDDDDDNDVRDGET